MSCDSTGYTLRVGQTVELLDFCGGAPRTQFTTASVSLIGQRLVIETIADGCVRFVGHSGLRFSCGWVKVQLNTGLKGLVGRYREVAHG